MSAADLGRCLEGAARSVVGGDPRPGLIEALNKIADYLASSERRRRFLLIDMPTGYGKSTLTIVLAKALTFCGGLRRYAERVIHVVPTRSLAYDLISRASRSGVEAYGQYMGLDPSLKSASFLAGLVFTTVDSYTLNLFKAPVAEFGGLVRAYVAEEDFYGHFELPRYAIFTGLSVFDEYHLMMPLEPRTNKQATVFLAALRVLANYGSPAILESATGLRILEDILRQRGLSVSKFELKPQHDSEFFESRALQQITTRVQKVDGKPFPEGVAELAAELAERFRSVGVVVNTVERALKIYRLLRERLSSSIVLLHSRFRRSDVEKKLDLIESAIKDGRPIVVVATQVVEVGLDLDFDAMVTEIAPMPSLVQRVGRLCRNPKKECNAELHIVADAGLLQSSEEFYTVYSAESVRATYEILEDALGRDLVIQWKIPVSPPGSKSYRELIDEVYRRLNLDPEKFVDSSLERRMLNLGSRYVFDSKDALDLLRELGGSLVRDETLVSVYLATSCREEKAPQRELDEYSLPVQLGMLRRKDTFRDDLLCVEDGRVLAVASPLKGEGVELVWIDGAELLKGLWDNLGVVEVDGKSYTVEYLVGRREKYSEELGFV